MKVSLKAILCVAGLALMGVLAGRDVCEAGGIRPTVSAVALRGDPAPGLAETMSCNAPATRLRSTNR